MSTRQIITPRVKTAEWLKSIERDIVSVFLVPNDQVLLFNYGCLLQIILACCSSRGEGGDQRTEAGRTSEEREESSNPAKWCWTSPPRPSQPLYPSSSASGPASSLALASVTRNRRPREHCSSLAQRPRVNWYIVSGWSDVRDTSVMTSDHGDIDTSQLLPTSFSLKLVDTYLYTHTFSTLLPLLFTRHSCHAIDTTKQIILPLYRTLCTNNIVYTNTDLVERDIIKGIWHQLVPLQPVLRILIKQNQP